jgi:ribonuclease HII
MKFSAMAKHAIYESATQNIVTTISDGASFTDSGKPLTEGQRHQLDRQIKKELKRMRVRLARQNIIVDETVIGHATI